VPCGAFGLQLGEPGDSILGLIPNPTFANPRIRNMPSINAKPRDVFKSAIGFHETAKLLIENRFHHREHHYGFPIEVNLAFSAELFIKSMLLRDGINYGRTHQIKVLFERLAPEHHSAIEKRFDAEVKKNEYISRIEAGNPVMQFKLNKVLEAGNNAFDEWRYIFEERDFTVYSFGLEELAKALRGHVQDIEPSW
jgi:hypothetical protein